MGGGGVGAGLLGVFGATGAAVVAGAGVAGGVGLVVAGAAAAPGLGGNAMPNSVNAVSKSFCASLMES